MLTLMNLSGGRRFRGMSCTCISYGRISKTSKSVHHAIQLLRSHLQTIKMVVVENLVPSPHPMHCIERNEMTTFHSMKLFILNSFITLW